MKDSFHPSSALPGDLIGRRICETFGCYRWNYIKARRPEPGQTPNWHTETTHPIEYRALWLHWQNPAVLIGVRFGQNTRYAVIDIDVGSDYLNPEAIAEIRAALETIGIVRAFLVRSSHSNGVHLYIPLSEAVNTFNLAVCLEECLTAQGFQIAGGTLESFPNPKPYGYGVEFTEFNAHSLPLQPDHGGCLLNDNLDPIGDSLEQFFELWDGAAEQQDMDQLRHAMKVARETRRQKKRRRDRTTSRATDEWREDLEAIISEGWTDHGQTNYLLNKIACYGRVFLRLEGTFLETYVEETAIQSSGYAHYCRHQHHIHRRAKAWARAAEKFYWPLGDEPRRDTAIDLPAPPSHNEQLAQDACRRIVQARAELEAENALPERITARRDAIRRRAQVSPTTMGRAHNLPLWHPDHYQPEPSSSEVPVLPDTARVSGENQIIPQIPNKSLKQRNIKEVQTSEKIMKCVQPSEALPEDEVEEQTTSRGVRGDFDDELSFEKPVVDDSSGDELISDDVAIEDALGQRAGKIFGGYMVQLGWSDRQRDEFLEGCYGVTSFESLSLEDRITLLSELEPQPSGDLPKPSTNRQMPLPSPTASQSNEPPVPLSGEQRVVSKSELKPRSESLVSRSRPDGQLVILFETSMESATTWTAFQKAVEQRLDYQLEPVHCKRLKKLWPERAADVCRLIEQVHAQRDCIHNLGGYLTGALQKLMEGTWSLVTPVVPEKTVGLSDRELQWLELAKARGFILDRESPASGIVEPVCDPSGGYTIRNLMNELSLEELAESSEPISHRDACDIINDVRAELGWPPLP